MTSAKPSAQTMADVIIEHERVQGIRDMAIHCKCGWSEKTMMIRNSRKAFAAHQSDMLTAAGFGPVNRVRHDAYNSGYAAGRTDGMLFPPTRTGTKR